MKSRPKTTILVLLAYLLVGPLLELVHTDGNVGGLASPVRFSQHARGEMEHHVPLDGHHECLACVVSAGRLALPPSQEFISCRNAAYLPFLPPVSNNIPKYRLELHHAKRGPPDVS